MSIPEREKKTFKISELLYQQNFLLLCLDCHEHCPCFSVLLLLSLSPSLVVLPSCTSSRVLSRWEGGAESSSETPHLDRSSRDVDRFLSLSFAERAEDPAAGELLFCSYRSHVCLVLVHSSSFKAVFLVHRPRSLHSVDARHPRESARSSLSDRLYPHAPQRLSTQRSRPHSKSEEEEGRQSHRGKLLLLSRGSTDTRRLLLVSSNTHASTRNSTTITRPSLASLFSSSRTFFLSGEFAIPQPPSARRCLSVCVGTPYAFPSLVIHLRSPLSAESRPASCVPVSLSLSLSLAFSRSAPSSLRASLLSLTAPCRPRPALSRSLLLEPPPPIDLALLFPPLLPWRSFPVPRDFTPSASFSFFLLFPRRPTLLSG